MIAGLLVSAATYKVLGREHVCEPYRARFGTVSEALQQRFDCVVPKGAPPPEIYRAIARNEAMFVHVVDTGLLGPTGLFDRGVLPSRLRELLILRTCVAARND